MQRRTTIWFLLLFQPFFVLTQNQSDAYECKIGSINPLAATSLNACYKLYDTPKTYQAARKHCVSLGGQLAEKINKEDASLYSANADLEVTNATQFWVGASNLKCNIGWENGGEIEFNELWASDSRYYGVAIDKMSLGGLWHTVPVGHQLPFVCTFQGKSKDAAPPLHAMRAPAKKRPGKEKPEEDIDDSLNAALLNQKSTSPAPVTSAATTTKDEDIDDSLNAALLDQKSTTKGPAAIALAEKMKSQKKEESADEDSSADSASIADQKALNASAAMAASAASASASNDESSDESLDASQIAMRKEVGLAAAVMKSQEMAAQSESFDEYTEEDLLAAAATIMGGYTLNLNWADRSTKNTSTFDSETDERTFSLAMTIAEQMVLAMEARRSKRKQNSESSSDEMSEESSLAMALADAMEMNDASKTESKSESKDESEDSDSMSIEQKAEMAKADAAKAEVKEEKKDEKKDQTEDDELADLESAAAILAGETNAPKATKTTTQKPTTTDDDFDDSLNAALLDRKSTSTIAPTTNSQNPDLTTVLTTASGILVGAVRPDRQKNPGCPAEWTQFNANATVSPRCFRRFDKPMNFEDARLFCLSKGGHLASIHNERQLLLLSALLHNNGPDTISNQTWIGLNRIHQKYYVYEDETAMDFTRWLPGAPNINDCTVFTGNELPNYPHKGTQYKFGDFPCEEVQKSVLCEVTLGKDKVSTQPSCQEGWSYYSHDENPEHGKCYKQIDASKKFADARQVCHAEDAYVASVQNEGEARFVSALLQTVKNYTVNEQTWIGYVKYNDKDFGWEDGNKGVQFDPWTEKMPRDKKCTVFTGNEIHEECRSKFRFVSVACDKTQRAVLCSKPPMKDGVRFVYKDTENSVKPI